MINKRKPRKETKNPRIGPWARPYVDELLRGNYIHHPALYISSGKHNKHYFTWIRNYNQSWAGALSILKKKHDIMQIRNIYQTDTIFVLRKFFLKFIKKRVIEQKENFILCRLENRNLFFRKKFPEGDFEIVSTRLSIQDILTKEVEEVLDDEKDKTIKEARPKIPRVYYIVKLKELHNEQRRIKKSSRGRK